MSSRIGRRITGSQKLNILNIDPLVGPLLPKSLLTYDLSHESDASLSSEFVLVWKVYLIAEENQFFIELFGLESQSLGSLYVLTALL